MSEREEKGDSREEQMIIIVILIYSGKRSKNILTARLGYRHPASKPNQIKPSNPSLSTLYVFTLQGFSLTYNSHAMEFAIIAFSGLLSIHKFYGGLLSTHKF